MPSWGVLGTHEVGIVETALPYADPARLAAPHRRPHLERARGRVAAEHPVAPRLNLFLAGQCDQEPHGLIRDDVFCVVNQEISDAQGVA